MKSSMKGFFIILAIVVSLVAVQSVRAADTLTVAGTIEEISIRPNMIVINEGNDELTEVFGVKFNYLATRYNIFLNMDDYVIFEVYEYICCDGTTKFMAYSLTVDDVTVVLRPVP